MKRNYQLVVIILAFLAGACSPSKESTGVWVNKEKIQGKSFSNLFIIVLTADIEARVALENDLAAVASSRGIRSVKSIDAIPPSLRDPKTPTRDEIVSKVKESGCDGVFVATLLKKDEGVRYTPGTTAYTVTPYYTYMGTYTGYYSYWQPTVSTPSYYSHDKDYFMQSNLYDAASEEIMWSVQSTIFSPSSIKNFSKDYTSTLVSQLQKAKLVKK